MSRPEISVEVVRGLIQNQFPAWAELPIAPVLPGGWDNRTFRLGDDMSVRLPSDAGYAGQVTVEDTWLPWLAPRLPLPIPVPLALGEPGNDYPWPWSVRRWMPGEPARAEGISDARRFAVQLAEFLVALQRLDATDGPPPGSHNGFRGAPIQHYDRQVQRSLELLVGRVDVTGAQNVWQAALETDWQESPVWIHGDVAVGNLLVSDGELRAVIDFGCTAVGDPACDLAIAWTLFNSDSRTAFRDALPLDAATWTRGRAWALWKALITHAGIVQTNAAEASQTAAIIEAVIHDDRRST